MNFIVETNRSTFKFKIPVQFYLPAVFVEENVLDALFYQIYLLQKNMLRLLHLLRICLLVNQVNINIPKLRTFYLKVQSFFSFLFSNCQKNALQCLPYAWSRHSNTVILYAKRESLPYNIQCIYICSIERLNQNLR